MGESSFDSILVRSINLCAFYVRSFSLYAFYLSSSMLCSLMLEYKVGQNHRKQSKRKLPLFPNHAMRNCLSKPQRTQTLNKNRAHSMRSKSTQTVLTLPIHSKSTQTVLTMPITPPSTHYSNLTLSLKTRLKILPPAFLGISSMKAISIEPTLYDERRPFKNSLIATRSTFSCLGTI